MSGAPVVVGALRTPIGTAGRSLAHVTAADLAATVVRELAAGRRPAEVVLGNCMGPGGDVARVAALAAGIGADVPAMTVDRQCASGLSAIVVAAAMLREAPGMVIAGGVESASTAPWRYWPPSGDTGPVRYERAPMAAAESGDPDMGLANDMLAAEAGISRAAQDEYAARSHSRTYASQRAGRYIVEIVPVGSVAMDDRPRGGLTADRLARLRPAFRVDGTVTAGNSCGVNDGAAAVTLVDSASFARLGVPGLRLLATATCAVDPARPGRGLVPAVHAVLDRAGITIDDIDVIELNEAFAGQILACCAELGIAPERVCPEGGALGLGHPWGASGAVLVVRLFSQLVRRVGGRFGLAAVAAGGGQGVTVVVEAVR